MKIFIFSIAQKTKTECFRRPFEWNLISYLYFCFVSFGGILVLFEFAAGGGDRQPVTDQTDMSGTRSRLSHSRLRGDNVVFGLWCAGLVHSHRGKHKMTEAGCRCRVHIGGFVQSSVWAAGANPQWVMPHPWGLSRFCPICSTPSVALCQIWIAL